VKVAAVYLILAGGISILLRLTGGSYFSEIEAKSIAFKLGLYLRAYIIDILFMISGIGLLCSKAWAKKLALVILIVGTIYSANDAAWGYARGNPSLLIRFVCFVVVGVWNGIWLYLVFKNTQMRTQEMTG